MQKTLTVRLGTSMTRPERTDMRRRFGASHVARVSRSLGPWSSAPCTCHSLVWDTNDLSWSWGATVADQKATCPLAG